MLDSTREVVNSVWNRSKAKLMLDYLDVVREIVESPDLVEVRMPLSGERISIEALGFDAEKVLVLREEWRVLHEDRKVIMGVRSALDAVLDVFDLQMCANWLSQLNRRLDQNDYRLETGLCRRDDGFAEVTLVGTKEYFTVWMSELSGSGRNNLSKEFMALDSHYYTRGRSYFHAVGKKWEEAQDSEFCRFFLLTAEEVDYGLRVLTGAA